MFSRSLVSRFAALCAVLLIAVPAMAQPSGPDQHSEQASTDAPAADETLAELAAGGQVATGNTESWQVNGGGRLRLVRGPHAFAAEAQFAYGAANLPDDMSNAYQDTVRQINARGRYDFYFTDDDAVFVGEVYRWDTFAGLDTRLQTQVGYLRNLYAVENHRLWVEAGYDFTYDNYHLLPTSTRPFQDQAYIHSARGYVGYDNHLNEAVTFTTGLEALFNVEDGEDVRVNWDSALRSSLAGNLQLELKHSLKLDNVPPQGAKKLDTLTLISLIYSFMDEKDEAAQ